MYPNPQAPIFKPSLNPQASVFQPTKSKPVYTKNMSPQIPNEVKMTQEGEWQLVESEGSDSKDYGTESLKDADQNSQASSSTLIGPFRNSNNNNCTKPAVSPIITTAEAHGQFQTQHLTHLPHVHSSVYARAQASAEADADAYYQAYTQIDLELQTLLERQAEIEAQFQAQAQAQSHLHALVQITLSDGTVYMFPSHHTFWCYEHDGVYTLRTLASVMFRAEVGDWPGYWLRGQAAMGGSLVFVRT